MESNSPALFRFPITSAKKIKQNSILSYPLMNHEVKLFVLSPFGLNNMFIHYMTSQA